MSIVLYAIKQWCHHFAVAPILHKQSSYHSSSLYSPIPFDRIVLSRILPMCHRLEGPAILADSASTHFSLLIESVDRLVIDLAVLIAESLLAVVLDRHSAVPDSVLDSQATFKF